ncbi:MAG: PAS domain S-box protein [Candidatus Sumerlaeia bacterium]|nr:PAS domain S-box protein [Candidatus Sumerlaeia bacterium]
MAHPVVIYNSRQKPISANPAALAALGLAPSAKPAGPELAAALQRMNLRHDDGRPVAPDESPAHRALRGQVVRNEPHIIADKNGRDRCLLISCAPFRVAGRIAGAISIWHDVTEQRRAALQLEQALQDSRRRQMEIAALLAGARVILEKTTFVETAETIFAFCKNLIQATAGYIAILSKDGTQNEVVFLDAGGLPCNVDPSLPMPIRGLREVTYRTGEPVFDNDFPSSRWMEYMPEGHAVLQNVLFAPMKIENRVVGLIGLANKPGGFVEHDARMATAFGELAALALQNSRAREALEHSEARFRSLAETANDAVITIDAAGKIVFWNRAAETIFGYSADEMLGQPLERIIPESMRAAHRCALLRVAETGQTRLVGKTLALPGLRKDGSEFPLELSLASWQTVEGRFFTGIVRDITERKRAEAEIRALNAELAERIEQLRAANADLESFSYSVSHDLRSPLAVIDGFSHVLSTEYSDRLDEEGKRFLDLIRSNTRQMGQLIEDLLAFSRTGRQPLSPAPVNMDELVQIVLAELQPTWQGRNVQLDIRPLPPARGDWSLLRQVWTNLLSNALKFTRHRPTARVEVGGESRDGESIYYVKDNGAGFDMQYAGKLFGVFQRLHSTEEFEGTGVGLAIVQRIVRRHGGRVWAEGKVGEGAVFYFTLPQ